MGGLGLFARRRAIASSPTMPGIEIMNYIELDGIKGQTIDTGYYANPMTEIDLYVRCVSNANTSKADKTGGGIIFNARDGGNCLTVNHGSEIGQLRTLYVWTPLYYGFGGTIKELTIANLIDNDLHMGFEFVGSAYYFYVGDSRLQTTGSPNIVFSNPLTIGGSIEAPYKRTNLRIYRIAIKEQGVQLHDFVPAIKNGIAGLYDNITKVFVTAYDGSDLTIG